MYNKDNIIKVITGPMFSGKSYEMIRLIHLCNFAGKNVFVFTPIKNTRENDVSTRLGISYKSIQISSLNEITNYVINNDNLSLFIEEFHLFNEDINIIDLIRIWQNDKDIDIYISGLDMDYLGNPFENMMKVMGIATEIVKLKAVCKICGCYYATMSYKKTNSTNRYDIDEGQYIPVCYSCYKALCK